MNGPRHNYAIHLDWTGNRGTGTSGYRDYDRAFEVNASGKGAPAGSSDPSFRGDRTRWNPEEMLLSALSSCHMLSYLHLCADTGVVVLRYADEATGAMELQGDGSGRFVSVTLRPRVQIARENSVETARQLHHRAHELCFIANSVNFPVSCEATVCDDALDFQEQPSRPGLARD